MFGKERHKRSAGDLLHATSGQRTLLWPRLLVAFIGGWVIALVGLTIIAPTRDDPGVGVTLPISPITPNIPVGLPRGEIPLALPPEATPVVPVPPIEQPAPPIERTAIMPLPAVRPLEALPQWRRNAVILPESANKPMIAIVIDDMGLNPRRSAAVMKLPGPLTLAFLPYANELPGQTAAAHAQGHELMVHVSMQPLGADNPGPNALTTNLPSGEIKRRLAWALGTFDGYVGINNHMGSLFTTDREGMAVVMAELKARGLLFLDSRTGPNSVGNSTATALGVPHAARHVFIDHEISAGEIARQLGEVEKIARQTGFAVAIGHPHELTVAALKTWLPSLEAKGFVLAPISAIVARLETRRDAGQSSTAPPAP